MPPDWLPSFSLRSSQSEADEVSQDGTPAWHDVQDNPWAASGLLLLAWLLFIPVFFLLAGVILDSFALALVLAPFLALAATGALAYWRGWHTTLDRARQGSPLWARLLYPIPLFALLYMVSFIAFGAILTEFTLLAASAALLALALTGALVWISGMWSELPEAVMGLPVWARLLLPLPLFAGLTLLGFPLFGGAVDDFRFLLLASLSLAALGTGLAIGLTGLWHGLGRRVRASSPTERLTALTILGLLAGLVAFLATLTGLEQVEFALAAFLPSALAGFTLAGWALGWLPHVHKTLAGWHFGTRIGLFTGLLLVLILYFSLLVGPFLPNALIGYTVSTALALALLVPFSMWTNTWTDTWRTFVSLGEDRRVLATLPILPLSAVLLFLLLAFLSDSFAIAYTLSIPLGVALFLLTGTAFGITQDIPRIVRRRSLPARLGIFAAFFLLVAAYAYFAVALFVQIVEVALVASALFSGALLAGLIVRLELGEGFAEEFESYPPVVEAGVLAAAFLASLAVVFTVVALAAGDFRAAFLVSVVAAAGLTYVLAHATGLVGGIRETVQALDWWGEIGALLATFALAFVYGTVAVGIFAVPVELAVVIGALFGLGAVFALSKDLALGHGVMTSADEHASARISILVLTFLAAFLVGMYTAALALGAVGVSLFGLPFFVSLVLGTAAVMGLARHRGWDADVVARVRTARDKGKTLVILAAWIGLGTLTGFALQAIPVEGPILGLGDATGLPLALTLAVGLVLWAWLPVVLFHVTHVEQTPVDATLTMTEKRRTMASLAWGLLAFGLVLVIALTVLDGPVWAVVLALGVGYLTALVISSRRGRKPEES